MTVRTHYFFPALFSNHTCHGFSGGTGKNSWQIQLFRGAVLGPQAVWPKLSGLLRSWGCRTWPILWRRTSSYLGKSCIQALKWSWIRWQDREGVRKVSHTGRDREHPLPPEWESEEHWAPLEGKVWLPRTSDEAHTMMLSSLIWPWHFKVQIPRKYGLITQYTIILHFIDTKAGAYRCCTWSLLLPLQNGKDFWIFSRDPKASASA